MTLWDVTNVPTVICVRISAGDDNSWPVRRDDDHVDDPGHRDDGVLPRGEPHHDLPGHGEHRVQTGRLPVTHPAPLWPRFEPLC